MRIGQYDITNDSSGNQFILSEASIVTDKDSKNFGKEILSRKRYFTSWQGMLSYVASNEMMDLVGGITELSDCITEFKSRLDSIAKDLEDEYKKEK